MEKEKEREIYIWDRDIKTVNERKIEIFKYNLMLVLRGEKNIFGKQPDSPPWTVNIYNALEIKKFL